MADDVRRLIAEVHQHEAGASRAGDTANTDIQLAGIDPLQALAAPGFSVKSWQPPSIDQTKIASARHRLPVGESSRGSRKARCGPGERRGALCGN